MPVTIERLPGERAATTSGAAAAGACCSCCCCCLHSLGGIVLSATARAAPVVEPGARTSVRKEYWLSFGAVCVVAMCAMVASMRVGEALLFGAIFLPGAQLAASVMALIASSASKTPGHAERLRHLGWITLLGVIGAIVGAAVMWVAFNVS